MTPERYRELQEILERDGVIEFEDDEEAQEFAELGGLVCVVAADSGALALCDRRSFTIKLERLIAESRRAEAGSALQAQE
jgi:hypothetical protein